MGGHGVGAIIPAVEGANHADTQRVGCPNRKVDPGDAFNRAELCAKLFEAFQKIAFAVQVDIQLAQQEWEAIGVFQIKFMTFGID